jgi:hypothetical protein
MNIKGKLEPEYASNIKTAAGSQVRSRNGVTGELWKRKSVSKAASACRFNAWIHGCEVCMIECIQCSEAKLEGCPLIEALLDARPHLKCFS